MHRRLLVLVVVAGTVLGALVVGTAPAPAREAAPRAQHPVGLRVLSLVDTSRATPPDPDGPVVGSPTRRLLTSVFYPAAGRVAPATTPTYPLGAHAPAPVLGAPIAAGRFPVVLFSGGAPGTAVDYAPLLATWATLGYVVVEPQFPVSSLSGPTPMAWSDQRDQVRDARFVLDRVLALDHRSLRDGGFGHRLDRRHVAAAGHSMGGLTTLALVSRCCRDPRISAALVLAGVSQPVAGPALTDVEGPVLFAHSSSDPAVPFLQGREAFAAARPPKYFLEIRYALVGGAAHLLTYFPGTPFAEGVAAVFADFFAGYLRGDTGALGRMAADARSEESLHWQAVR